MAVNIIGISDIVYLNYFSTMVRSAAVNFPQAKVLCHLINVPRKKQDDLKSLHPDIEVTTESIRFKSWKPIRKYIYCANKRAELLCRAVGRGEALLYLDADSIIRKQCVELVDILSSCDITVKEKKKKHGLKARHGRFSAGIIGFGKGLIVKEFIKRYAYIVEHDLNSYSDQYNLYEVYREFKDRINYVPLPERFCDTRLSNDGVIWNGKSSRKTTAKYKKEMKKYAR